MRFLHKIKALFQHCEHATYLMVKDEHHSISVKERLHLKIHLLFCGACRRFQQQSKFINTWLRKKNQTTTSGSKLSAEEKEKLTHLIKEHS